MTPTPRSRSLLALGILAVVFGLMTIMEGGRTLFLPAARANAGNVVPFVLIFNFCAGFIYVLAGALTLIQRSVAIWIARALALSTLLIFAALVVHILLGGAYEIRTLFATIFRSGLWIMQSLLLPKVIFPKSTALSTYYNCLFFPSRLQTRNLSKLIGCVSELHCPSHGCFFNRLLRWLLPNQMELLFQQSLVATAENLPDCLRHSPAFAHNQGSATSEFLVPMHPVAITGNTESVNQRCGTLSTIIPAFPPIFQGSIQRKKRPRHPKPSDLPAL